jgi:hypothetical protein
MYEMQRIYTPFIESATWTFVNMASTWVHLLHGGGGGNVRQDRPDASRLIISRAQSVSGKLAIEVATSFSSRLGKSAKTTATTPTPTTIVPITLFLYGATIS